MGGIKAPRSLRSAFDGTARPLAVGAGLVAAAYVSGTDVTKAQTNELPAVNVEASVAAKPKKKKQIRPDSAAASAAATDQANAGGTATQAGPGGSGTKAAADANPFANPAAPYDVQRSSLSTVTQPLAEVARTIVAIPKEVIEEKAATSLRELFRTTPGVTLGTGEGGNAFGDRVFIRGFDARNDMYVDGIRQSGVTTRETFMTEQVDVIMGPAGTLAGRGSAGGAVNVATKQVAAKSFYEATAIAGTDPLGRVTFDANSRINDEFGIRVNGMAQQGNVPGRDHVFDNRYGGSVAGLWQPTDKLKVTLDYFGVYFDQMPDWGVPFDPRTRRPFTESGLNRATFYGIQSRDFQHNSQQLATQGIEYQVNPDLVVSNKLRFSYTITDYIASKPGSPNLSAVNTANWLESVSPTSRYQTMQTVGDQLQATTKFNTGPASHTLVTGVEAMRESIMIDSYAGLQTECNPSCSGNSIITNLWNPTTWGLSSYSTPYKSNRPTKGNVNTAAAFALDTVEWNAFALNVGARVDSYRVDRTNYGQAVIKSDDVLFNYNAGLTYKITPNGNVYASYATSSSPVGSELDGNGEDYGGLTVANYGFRPLENTSLEVGTKWQFFNNRLLTSAALFQNTQRNAREVVNNILQDTASYRVQGVQFGVGGNITNELSIFGGAVFMDSNVTRSALAANLGQPLANIAQQSFNVLAKYQITPKFNVGAQATYKGDILGGTVAATNFAAGTAIVNGVRVATPSGYNVLPGGWRFDLMSEYQFTDNFSAQLQVMNLFDKTLYDALYRSNTPYVYVAPGRTAYLTLKAKF